MSHVVVVGLGYGGHTVARELAKNGAADVTGINSTPYLQHNIASLRALADVSFADKIAAPLSNLFAEATSTNNELVFAHATIDRDEDAPAGLRITADGKQFRPDYVVIATGSSYNFPGKVAAKTASEVKARFEESHAILTKPTAARVVIVGGGPVGLELAGEIRHYFPDKQVTIIQAGNAVLSGLGLTEETQQNALVAVEKLGINVVFDRVTKADIDAGRASATAYLEGSRVLRTESGKEIPADLVYFATGNSINSSAYATALASAVGPNGRLQVNDFLQVHGFERVFALGDAANIEWMMAYCAGNQATNVVENIQHLQKGEPLKPYEKLPAGMAVTLGPNEGTGHFGGPLASQAVSGMKGKNMFVDRFWSGVNAAPPA